MASLVRKKMDKRVGFPKLDITEYALASSHNSFEITWAEWRKHADSS
ncbi:MAG: hypothetical protein ABJM39_06130 [Porticoccus sp.]